MPGFDPITASSVAIADLEHCEAGPPYRGGVDHLQLPILSGWALDLRDPDRSVGVTVLVDGVPLVRCEAKEARGDIARFVPGTRPGFRVDLHRIVAADLAAAVARLLRLDEVALAAPAPLLMRLDDEATLSGGTLAEITARELLTLLMHGAAPALDAALDAEPPERAGPAATIAALSTEVLLFDEAAYLHANPKAQDEARSALGAAFRHWIAEGGEGYDHPHRTRVTAETEPLLLAELALAEGRPGGARHWLQAALSRLLGPQPRDFAEAIEAVLTALEIGGAESGPPGLLARAVYAGALALGPEASARLLPRLASVVVALHPAHRSWPTRDTDLHWWSRLAPLLWQEPADPAALCALCLEAWQHPAPWQRQLPGTPVPPTNALRRILLLVWSASAGAAGDGQDALAAALALSRELLGIAKHPWRSTLRRALRPLFERDAPPPPAALAAILCGGFEGAFGPRRLPAAGALLRRIGLDTAGMFRLAPPERRRSPLDVAFLVGMRDGESHRYRVLNIADALEDAGQAVTTLLPDEHEALAERCTTLGRLVVFRAALEPPLEALIGVAHGLGASLSYDIDDLVFDPSLAPELKALDLAPPEERAHTLGWMRRYREAMLAADAATASTAQLAGQMGRHGLPASVVPNTHGPFERLIAARTPRDPDAPVTIAYFSGTWTHHADFDQCDAAIRAVIARHPEVRFLLAGNLRLGPEWDALRGQVDRAPFLPHPMMLALHARVDVMLAPLELDNAFCDSKSELKIFEAALFGVPSVASPTGPYAAAVEDGVSGILADTPAAWEAALERLLSDPAERRRMGEAARARATRDFADAPAARAFAAGLPALPPRRRLSLCVLLPGEDGAPRREVLALCRRLALLGHAVVAVVGPREGRREIHGLRRALEGSGVRLDHRPPVLPFDLVLATTAAAMEPALSLCARTGAHPLRLALSYEPWLHPVGEAAILAEASLAHVVPTIARTPYLARLLHDRHGIEAAHYDISPDRSAFFPRPEIRRSPNRVVALTRPGEAGACHALAMAALRLLRARAPRLEIVVLGSGAEAGLGEPLERHGWPMHPDDAARLFSGAGAGLCIAAAGPSRDALEMLACGLPVVDVAWSGTRYASDLERAAILHAEPTAAALADALHRLLHDAALRDAQLTAAASLLDGLPGPIGQARQLEALLLKLAPAR